MTYFGFLALFVGIPILLLLGVTWWDGRNGRYQPAHLRNYSPWLVLGIHILVALIYTTPWDNYLVATGVWWYDPALVTGVTIGWVPIEEYTFFIVQPVLTGLWLLFWMRRSQKAVSDSWKNASLRRWSVLVSGVIWVAMVTILAVGWQPGTYLALELGWALPPIMLQLFFGADILWRRRRLVALALIPVTLYLAAADALAIQSGTWTINPQKSLHWLLGGILPIEEFVFFLITNVLILFGMTLALSAESRERLACLRQGMGIKHANDAKSAV
ncbi:MAG: lycopene cyclase domain-containing protein [Anaerolinea sp.]|nr:lycopene cyclase domain-containing protein [Anaerolinea sp.]